MKDQFIIGKKIKGKFVRIYDAEIFVAASLDMDEAKYGQKIIKGSKIYKLVEIKK